VQKNRDFEKSYLKRSTEAIKKNRISPINSGKFLEMQT